MNWQYLHSKPVTSLKELRTVLLQNRNIEDESTFFNPLSPLELTLKAVGIDEKQVTKALARLQTAQEQQQDVLVFGDYDADGICATAVMWLTLHACGFKARPFIPHRAKHGYGLSEKALTEILDAQKPDVIITVDNGIVASQQIEWLNQQGVDVIVTDHHQPESEAGQPLMPPALAVVHTTQLCGTTVGWMLAKEIAQKWGEDQVSMADVLDLCGIATIADQVPLQKTNRSFALFGVEALQKTTRPGLKMLCQAAGVELPQVSVTTVNYVLAPRINAMGRLDHGLDALRLLCTSNPARAQALALTLSSTNTKRQTLTDDLLKLAQSQAHSWENEHLIIAYSETFHDGVIGLIAGRLMELYHKPAIVLSVGPETAKASARSIPGVNIVELIRLVRDDLLEVGGHPMAAGFGLVTSKLEVVSERLRKLAKDQIAAEALKPMLEVECELDPQLATVQLTELLSEFEPFGQGNHQPVFALKKMQVLDVMSMGKEGQHLKLVLCDKDGELKPINALAWRMAKRANELLNQCVSLAGTVELNEWKGKKSLQVVVKDVRLS